MKSGLQAMMAQQPAVEMLQLNVLGIPEIRLGAQPTTVGTAKAKALLLYLAVTGRPHSRAALVDLLWGEMAEVQARRNLTATLTNLRQAFAPFLDIATDRVAFRSAMPHTLDLTHFEAQLAQAATANDMRSIREAVALIRGEFLAGLTVKEAPRFDEWVYTERERLREQHLSALQRLVDDAVANSDYAGGLDYAHQLLALDPWREVAHRQLMTLHAQQGRRDAALLQYEECRKILAAELGVTPSAETMALHLNLLEAAAPPPHNLPPPPNGFVGRTTEIAEITQMLCTSTCRLLTVIGPGGVGKTRLAIDAARHLVEHADGAVDTPFPDGVYLVQLAALMPSTPTVQNPNLEESMVIAIAKALGIEFRGTTPLHAQLLGALADKVMLLICDNFEQLLTADTMGPALGVIEEILQKAPQVKFLVTSRARLQIQEEWLLEVAGLAYPLDERWQHEPLTALEAYSAVALFQRRARQAQVGFALTAQNAPAVVQICRQLAGLPLALELAAGWLPHLTCAEIVAEIEQGLDFLTSDVANLPARHRSLHAVFAHSWELLSAEEQDTLRKLSVFVDGFSREAAAAVAGASRLMIVRLADKSLLQRAKETLVSGRYTMHDLIRRFVEEKLDAQPDAAVEARHAWCSYFAHQLKTLEPDFQNEKQPAAYAWMHQEIDDLTAAWAHANRAESFAIVESFVEGFGNYYTTRAQYHQGHRFMTEALARLRADQSSATAEEKARQIALAKTLSWRSIFTSVLRQFRQTEEDLQESLTLARQAASPKQIVTALGWLAILAGRQQNYEQMHDLADEGLAVARAAGLSILEARMLFHLGSAATRIGEYANAEALLHQTLVIYRQHAHHLYIDLTSAFLADILKKQGKFAQANAMIQAALDAQTVIGSQHRRHELYHHLGDIAQALGDYTAAEAHYTQSIAFCREVSLQFEQTPARIGLGAVARLQGKLAAAKAALTDCLAFIQENELTEQLGPCLYQLGVVTLAEADLPRAQRYFVAGHQAYEQTDQREGTALALCGIGQMALRQAHLDESCRHVRKALAQVPHDADPVNAAILITLAETLLEVGQVDTGRQLLALIRTQSTAWAETRQVAEQLWATHIAAVPDQSSQLGNGTLVYDPATKLVDQLPQSVCKLL